MFKKKSCKKCGKKINNNDSFCSNCGYPINSKKQEDFGMLGKNDFEEPQDIFNQGMFGGFGGNMLGKMLNNAMKMLEKEMQKEMKDQRKFQPKTNIRLMINGKEIKLNNQQNNKNTTKKAKKQTPNKILPQNKLKDFAKLPKEDPKTNIRRLSNKVIYEIEMPDVKSIKDLSINKLENSIEIKALGKNKAYFKIIPINLPIIDYSLIKNKLVLELEAKN